LNERISYERILELSTKPITINKDFPELEEVENPISQYLIKFAFFGIVIGYLTLLFLDLWKRIKEFINKLG